MPLATDSIRGATFKIPETGSLRHAGHERHIEIDICIGCTQPGRIAATLVNISLDL